MSIRAATSLSTIDWRRRAPNTWAIGECAGSPQFTHASMDDFRVIRDNLAGGDRSTRDRMMPYCMYTDPPLARVGLSEEAGNPRRSEHSRGADPDRLRAARPDDLGNARFPQGGYRRGRPHPRLHDDRSRRRAK